jgi:superfamily II DNA/RNA helicase
VLARGIDVPEVDLVISYDVPIKNTFGFKEPDYANFMHRVGRTGRYGTDGLAVTLMSDEIETDLIE